MVGGLLIPCEVAVTSATPTGPGVQIWGVLSESHVPAHAVPLFATVKTAVLLETKVTGVVIVVFLLFCGVAVKVWVELPTSSETGPAGARTIFAGAGKEVVLVGLLLLQLVRLAIKMTRMKMDANRTKSYHLPMHPPRPFITRRDCLF